ncbi:patatin-like phospholipase family protein [Streptomyces sp. NPDC056112]|uniref:patatin-like phospholipase family protein n=1 Tax=Streptomyces sp. NPDC056112 TaxID=3345715 RepID=UPI0035DF22D3
MTTAFALSGGGSLGATQVGMLRALTDCGIRADLVVGASVGALNAACYAARPDTCGVEKLTELWRRVGEHDVYPLEVPEMLQGLLGRLAGRRMRGPAASLGFFNYVFPINPLLIGRAAAGRTNHVFSNRRFRTLLDDALPLQRIEDARSDLKILATDTGDGQAVLLTGGPVVPALLASIAVPGFYPPVEIDGRQLIDGAVANRTTLDHALELGADEVYVLAPGMACHLSTAPSTVLAMAIHAYNLLEEQRMAASIRVASAQVRLHVLPSPCPVEILPMDFRQTEYLIRAATDTTRRWLALDRRAEPGAPQREALIHPGTLPTPPRTVLG